MSRRARSPRPPPWWEDTTTPPDVLRLARLCGMPRAPQVGDVFRPRYRPRTMAYSAPPEERGEPWGPVPADARLLATRVMVQVIPPDARRRLPEQWGIVVRSPLPWLDDVDGYVNISRARTQFATLLTEQITDAPEFRGRGDEGNHHGTHLGKGSRLRIIS